MNSYSQHQEDTYILHFCFVHKIDFPTSVIEIGACDGINLSNSRAYCEIGWHGLLVEPQPEYYKRLEVLYENIKKVKTFNVAISDLTGKVKFDINKKKPDHSCISDEGVNISSLSYPDLLQLAKWDKPIGVLSIDAEGYDTEILNQVLRTDNLPYFIIIESNDTTERREQIELFNDKYTIINVLSVNMVLCRSDLIENLAT